MIDNGFMIPENKTCPPPSHGNKIEETMGKHGCFEVLGIFHSKAFFVVETKVYLFPTLVSWEYYCKKQNKRPPYVLKLNHSYQNNKKIL
jgi:hypothetical protein